MSPTLFWLLVQASGFTVLISTVSIAIGLALAMLVSAGMLSQRRSLAVPARIFVSFFRGVPLLVQLLLIYNLLPAFELNVPGVVAAVIGLSLCNGRLPGREPARRLRRRAAGPRRGRRHGGGSARHSSSGGSAPRSRSG